MPLPKKKKGNYYDYFRIHDAQIEYDRRRL